MSPQEPFLPRHPSVAGDAQSENGTETMGMEEWLEDLSSLPHEATLEAGSSLRERYRIEERLGRGGYAVVYAAHDQALDRDVAIKVLHASRIGTKAFSRLKREVKVARDVAHPNLLRVWDVDRDGDYLFLVMEKVTGSNLRERLAGGPLDVSTTIEIGRQILRGLTALHHGLILHRDLKPANVLIDSKNQVVIADFGLASYGEGIDQTQLTATDGVVGTLEYLAPEVICGEPASPSSDLYACGLLFYEMLAGALPYRGSTSLGAILNQLKSRRSPIARVVPGIPDWLGRFIDRLLETRPGDRYVSAEVALRDLERGRVRPGAAERRRLRRWALLGLTGGALFLGVMKSKPDPAFSHLAGDAGDTVVRAISKAGDELWSFAGSSRSLRTLRLMPGQPLRVAAIAGNARTASSETLHELLILDANRGRIEKRQDLPDGAHLFSGFSGSYQPELTVLDLDGDGADEVIVTYVHSLWPSYMVLFEPKLRRARLVFAAGGHHRPLGAVDLDGDGRDELVVAGWANRLGQMGGIGAIRLSPPVNLQPEEPAVLRATTPDRPISGNSYRDLLWYEVVPQCSDRRCGFTLTEGGELSRTEAGVEIRLDPRGLRIGPSFGERDLDVRVADRERAYDALHRSRQAHSIGNLEEAESLATGAAIAARRAGCPDLAAVAESLALTSSIASGAVEASKDRIPTLLSEGSAPLVRAVEIGTALHLRGHPDLAADVYRQAVSLPRPVQAARHWRDLQLALFFARAELGQWEVARDELDNSTSPMEDFVLSSAFSLWKSQGTIDTTGRSGVRLDFELPVEVQLCLARGDSTATVRERLEEHLAGRQVSGFSILAEALLLQAEQHTEAPDRLQQAHELLTEEATKDAGARAFLEVFFD